MLAKVPWSSVALYTTIGDGHQFTKIGSFSDHEWIVVRFPEGWSSYRDCWPWHVWQSNNSLTRGWTPSLRCSWEWRVSVQEHGFPTVVLETWRHATRDSSGLLGTASHLWCWREASEWLDLGFFSHKDGHHHSKGTPKFWWDFQMDSYWWWQHGWGFGVIWNMGLKGLCASPLQHNDWQGEKVERCLFCSLKKDASKGALWNLLSTLGKRTKWLGWLGYESMKGITPPSSHEGSSNSTIRIFHSNKLGFCGMGFKISDPSDSRPRRFRNCAQKCRW